MWRTGWAAPESACDAVRRLIRVRPCGQTRGGRGCPLRCRYAAKRVRPELQVEDRRRSGPGVDGDQNEAGKVAGAALAAGGADQGGNLVAGQPAVARVRHRWQRNLAPMGQVAFPDAVIDRRPERLQLKPRGAVRHASGGGIAPADGGVDVGDRNAAQDRHHGPNGIANADAGLQHRRPFAAVDVEYVRHGHAFG